MTAAIRNKLTTGDRSTEQGASISKRIRDLVAEATPWPWRAFRDVHGHEWWEVDECATGTAIAMVHKAVVQGSVEANARLIAAAPSSLIEAADLIDEMLAALGDLLEHADAECVSGSAYEPIERARAAIARATGEAS